MSEGFRPTLRASGLAIITVLIACTAAAAGALGKGRPTATRWQERPGLIDARHDGASDLSVRLRSGPVRVDLPYRVIVDGQRHDGLLIGAGWYRWIASRPAVETSAQSTPTTAEGPRLGTRVDVLAGSLVELPSSAPVLLTVQPDGVLLRWTELRLATGGRATAEAILDRSGHATLQYLHLSPEVEAALATGELRAGVAGTRLRPDRARAYTLAQPVVQVRAPGAPAKSAFGGPPAGCDPAIGTWCQAVEGEQARILLAESFDDGNATVTRGWTAAGFGQEIDWNTCVVGVPPDEVGGALGNPGRSHYFGLPATCDYLDNQVGTLTSPVSAFPVTTATVMEFATRLGFEFSTPFPADTAEVLFNGTVIGNIDPTGLDPNLWYNFRLDSVDLGGPFFAPFIGVPISVQLRFTSDFSIHDQLGWMVDDIRVWDENVGRPNCLFAAVSGNANSVSCGETVQRTWSFNEGAFCEGCSYSFYVVVECGREMHLPLFDMEGVNLAITDVTTGMPVSLRCRNETSLADAGMGDYPIFLQADCDGDGVDEEWWAPAFDETDNTGPGRVTWGFPDCPVLTVYDVDVPPDGVQCDEIPVGGGLADLMTPGEAQVMDCFIEEEDGLCGLYRVDIISGGFVWDLFANCDGTGTEQFEIFHDCTDAWAAFTPLPELALSNLTIDESCPDFQVHFDLGNIGCADHVGDVTVRVVSDCDPADSQDFLVPGPVTAGSSMAVDLDFSASCAPASIEVFIDPDDAIVECTESGSVAACRAETGVDSITGTACNCNAMVTPDAGADQFACPGEMVTLDGSASVVMPCAAPEYRWVRVRDDMVVRDFDPDPTAMVLFDNCPDGEEYRIEFACNGAPCAETAVVRVDCFDPMADAGLDLEGCSGVPLTIDASGSTIPGCPTPEYRFIEPSGEVAQDWSTNATHEITSPDATSDGVWAVEVRCTTGGDCSDADALTVTVAVVGVDVIEDERFACEASPVDFTAADVTLDLSGCTAVEYQWLIGGLPFTTWSPTPDVSFPEFAGCPFGFVATLQVRCTDAGLEACMSSDDITVTCPAPIPPLPINLGGCGGDGVQLGCGASEAGVTYWWDLDLTDDADGNGDPTDDMDETGCDITATFGMGGMFTVRAWAEEPTAGCRAGADLEVEVVIAPPPGEVTDLRVSTMSGDLVLTWAALAEAADYVVVRGELDRSLLMPFSDHAAEDASGRGACRVTGLSLVDADDLGDGVDHYYLVAARNACDEEGSLGNRSDGMPRPARMASGDCP
ncbi:MAG: hypothetical protein AAF533_26260 [Acidobacteriota bacterium]